MATQSATFIFALPEDENSNQLLIKQSTTQNGSYSTVATVTYEYGTTTYEYDSLDDTKWYKIQFNNSVDNELGPISEAIYGGNFSNAAPFLAVSTGTDGANYASTQDVYDYATLTSSDVAQSKVSSALRKARAVIDLKTSTLDLDRYRKTFPSATARKKFNAQLRILKEAEINLALGNLYRAMADDLLMKRFRNTVAGETEDIASLSIGNTTVQSSSGPGNTAQSQELQNISARYLSIGSAMLSSLQPSTVRVHYEDEDSGFYHRNPKFKYPFNGWE